jgi:hypothetical protein
MIGRNTAVGISLLAVLCFCAFMAPSAFAVEGWEKNNNTTAYLCEKGAGTDFSDAHCDTAATGGTGSYGHKALEVPGGESITITNEATKKATAEPTTAVLETTRAGMSIKVTVTEIHGLGSLANREPKTGEHEVEGKVNTEYRSFMVDEPATCGAAEPIEFASLIKGVKNAKGEMGLEFSPEKGTVLLGFKTSGASCPFNGVTINFEGTAVSVGGAGASTKHSGATELFNSANQTLASAGIPASFSATITTKQFGNGLPIALTTPTKP